MSDLGVRLNGALFEHMVHHFVLTYSNWENCHICFSESFESVSEGLQPSLWQLGGVPQVHQTDRLSGLALEQYRGHQPSHYCTVALTKRTLNAINAYNISKLWYTMDMKIDAATLVWAKKGTIA